MLGMEAVQEVKPQGKVATVISVPFRAGRSQFATMKKSVENAISSASRLEEGVAEKKPSIIEALAVHVKMYECIDTCPACRLLSSSETVLL